MEMDPGKLFIGGISWDTNEQGLKDYFQTFGEVIEAVIMKDRTTGRARGFGFIIFSDPTVADTVVKDKHIIDGRTVEAKKAVPRDDRIASVHGSPGPIRTKKIFVGGLASTVTETDFKNYFDQFGSTTDVVVMYDHNTQRPRGFGFITYELEESVDKVLHKTFHELNGKMVEVKRAVPKEASPGPNRYNNGLSRVSSYLNSLGGYSPVSVGRTGFSPSSYNIAPGSNIGYARSTNSLYGVTPNRWSGSTGYDSYGDENVSLFNSRDIWGNGDYSYTNNNNNNNNNSQNSGSYGFGAIWGTPNSSTYGSRVNSIVYGRNNGGGTASHTSFGVTDDGSRSVYGDPMWRSSSPDLDIPGLFDYGFGGSDGVREKSVGYVGYSVAANRSNTGIAA